ncbi:uncharacterized protein THITE_2113321 [Thermothielavioides terrestris NRRL 8126]|uniref:Uncharacterized protein n=1 Tax=Thermothielavioides terrestris (strain ATCC 38088 / NRRL 8126) TaxID=578455 RepID=G2R2F4_THETT|nr:uncharacterized protein THITE_2113321 [Thermothielavioides terrestris NRRL 8126]AEO65827.1 hypothetical protein THITE_2113321 [Thermothielavioides terrestris NRRL 8126]
MADNAGNGNSRRGATPQNPAPASGASNPPATATPSIPSLAALASDPLRTHRTWIPKYGRVQKCDFCNGRAPGTLHFCSVCQLHICENCARDRRWHTERQHFIDADALDWTFRRGPNTASTRGGRRAQAPSSSSQQPRGRRGGDSRPSLEESHGVDDGHDGQQLSHPDHPPAPFASRTPRRPDARHHPYPPPPARHGYRPEPSFPRPSPSFGDYTYPGPMGQDWHGRPSSTTLAPIIGEDQTNVRHPDASAQGRMHQSSGLGHSPFRGPPDNTGSAAIHDNAAGDANARERRDNGGDGDGDDTGYVEKGLAGNNNNPPRRSDCLAESARTHPPAGMGTTGGNTTLSSQVEASIDAPPASAEEHDRLVLHLYEAIYGSRPELNPARVRTRIPDRWDGEWPTSTPQVHGEPSRSAPSQQGPGGQNTPSPFADYHREVWTATTEFQPHLSRPPQGYAEYSFHNYPTYPRDPSHTQGNPYAPTLRTTPAFHPLNERTTSELELMHQDRQLLREMQHAWNNQPVLLRLCRNGHRVYAIELLWDVCELRRSRVLIRDFAQVVHWFVTERDSQFRLQHTAAAAQPGYYQPPYPSYPPPGAPGNAR